MATTSHRLSAPAPVSALRQEWTFCVGAIDVIIKTLERLPNEALYDPGLDEQLNTLTDMVKRVVQLSGDVLAALPVTTNDRTSAAPIRRPNPKQKDIDLIKFDDGDAQSDIGSTALDLPSAASSTADDFVAHFFHPLSLPDASSALPETEQQQNNNSETHKDAVAEPFLSLMATPSIDRRRLSSASSTNDVDEAIVNHAFQSWEFARPRTYKYLSFDADIGKRIPAHIGFVESPAIFYVMPDANNGAYQALEEQLQLFGELLKSEKITLKSPRLDQPCIARYAADGQFYRAVLKSVGNSDCLVQYVDFGNSAFIADNELYPLPVDLLELPCAVLKCSISHVDTRDLTADVVEDFLKRCQEGNEAIVELSRLTNSSAAPSDHYWRVLLFNTDGNAVTWQKQKLPIAQDLDAVAINLSAQCGEAEEGRAGEARGRQPGADGSSAESAPVGDLLGLGVFAPQLTTEEELKRALAISMLEY